MLALLALALPVQPSADDATAMTLALPHDLRPGEIAFLEVTVGAIARGREVEVTTADGRLIGTVSPFGVPSGAEAGTYTMPVPADAIADRVLSLRLRITRPDGPPRAPTADEVKEVRLTTLAPRP